MNIKPIKSEADYDKAVSRHMTIYNWKSPPLQFGLIQTKIVSGTRGAVQSPDPTLGTLFPPA